MLIPTLIFRVDQDCKCRIFEGELYQYATDFDEDNGVPWAYLDRWHVNSAFNGWIADTGFFIIKKNQIIKISQIHDEIEIEICDDKG